MGNSQSLPSSITPTDVVLGMEKERGYRMPNEEDEPLPPASQNLASSRIRSNSMGSPDFRRMVSAMRLDSVKFLMSSRSLASSNEPSKPSPVFSNSTTGLTFAHILKSFVQQCGSREGLQELTVDDVKDRFIIPMTQNDRTSYCEMLRNDSHPAVKRNAQVYLIIPRTMKFLDAIDILVEQYESKEVIVWWDVFATNFHTESVVSATDLEAVLSRIIRTVETVLIFIPGPSLTSIFTSSQILFCTFFAIREKVQEAIKILMLEEVKVKFDEALENMAFSLTYDEDDEDRKCKHILETLQDEDIQSYVKANIGLLAFQKQIFGMFRRWLLSYMEDKYQNTYDLKRRLNLEKALLDIYRIEGVECSHLHKVVLANATKGGKKSIAHDTIEALAMTNKTASILTSLKQYPDAEKLYKVCLTERRRILGKRHEDTIATENNLASLYMLRGKEKEVLQLLKAYYDVRKKQFGDLHPVTVQSLYQLADAYERFGKVHEAEVLYHELWMDQVHEKTENDSTTLETLHRMCVLYCKTGQYNKAESLLLVCIERRQEILDENALETLSTLYWTGYCFHWQGKCDLAEAYYQECLQGREEVLGKYHTLTLQTLSQYASLLESCLRKPDEARVCWQDHFDRQREKHGLKHPEAILALNALANHAEKEGEYDQAEKWYVEIHQLCFEIFGDTDAHTLMATKQLAIIHEKQENFEDAEYYARSYKTNLEATDANPEQLFDATNVLASILWSAGKIKVAEALMDDLHMYCRKKFGSEHQYTIAAKKLRKEFATMRGNSLLNFSINLGSSSSSSKKALKRSQSKLEKESSAAIDENCIIS